MSRRHGPPLYGAKYCGNTQSEEVHDLDKEIEQCLVDEIVSSSRAVCFHSLEEAHEVGFNPCEHCLGESED
jgi:hypothetical protein